MSRYTDGMANKFKKTNLFYSDDFMKFQDPTYLGFKLFFLFDQPDSGILCEEDLPNTAMGYLIRKGDEQRAEYLRSFVKLLKKLNSEAPWFFQTIKGLDEAWKHGYHDDDFKPKLSKERKITIDCLDESIDLRITALMDLYRKSCFDWENRREVVPRNLRQFQVSIYVYEARSINRWAFPFRINVPNDIEDELKVDLGKDIKSAYDRLLGDDILEGVITESEPTGAPSALDSSRDIINPNISRLLFQFSMCEFLPDESGVIVTDISHKELGVKPQQIVFKYENVKEDNIYRLFHNKSVSDSMISIMDILSSDNPDAIQTSPFSSPGINNNRENPSFNPFNQIRDTAKDEIKKRTRGLPRDLSSLQAEARSRTESEVSRRVATQINRLLLGNAYGFSTDAIITGASQGIGGILSAARDLGPSPSTKNDTKPARGNVGFGESTSLYNE